MSVRFLNNNASNNTDVVSKTFPGADSPVFTETVRPWVRNPSWPSCEATFFGNDTVVGSYAVWPGGANFFALTATVSSGNYRINFGDGTITDFASGAQVNYEYNYSAAALVGTEAPVTFTDAGDLVSRTAHGYTNGMQVQFFNITTTTGIVNAQFYFVINATADTFQVAATVGGAALALTNNGTGQLLPYRVATVTIIRQLGGALNSVNLNIRHTQTNLQTYSTGWLDLIFAYGGTTTITISGVGSPISHLYLERTRIVSPGGGLNGANLFRGCRKLQSVSITGTSITSDASSMFSNCNSLQTVPLFNTAAVTDMSSMFTGCTSLKTVPLFNTASVTSMSDMFNSCRTLQTVPLFNTAAVTNMFGMLSNCASLQTVPLFNTAAVTNMNFMFSSCVDLVSVPLFNTAAVTNIASMFTGCTSLQTVPLFNTAAVTSMNGMFGSCASLQTVPLFNTAAVTNMSNMFNGCASLKTVPLFNTASVTSMIQMFGGCASLQTVPLFNTAAVTNMNFMFLFCTSLQTVPLFNTAAVTNMGQMFQGCPALSTVPLFNTAAVTDMTGMFISCSALSTVPLLNTASVISMTNMFNSCSILTTIPLFNTAAVTFMNQMFFNCGSLQTIPLSNTASVTDMSNMFNTCGALISVPALVTTSVTFGNFGGMFTSCPSLSQIQARNFRFTFSVANCKLSATALDEVYTNLPTVTSQTITVSSNYGTATDNPSIATAKGWTVTG